eukprot:2115838-Prymnesium_polylepis.1
MQFQVPGSGNLTTTQLQVAAQTEASPSVCYDMNTCTVSVGDFYAVGAGLYVNVSLTSTVATLRRRGRRAASSSAPGVVVSLSALTAYSLNVSANLQESAALTGNESVGLCTSGSCAVENKYYADVTAYLDVNRTDYESDVTTYDSSARDFNSLGAAISAEAG